MTAPSEDDTLRQALLSPSTEAETSFLEGNIEESPSRSFMDASFFAYLRHGLEHSPFVHPVREEDEEHEDAEEPETNHPVVIVWNDGIARYHGIILIAMFLLLWPFGCLSFRALERSTDSTFHPVPGSPSAAAQQAFRSVYSNDDWMDPMNPPLLVILESTTNLSLTDTRSPAYSVARNFSFSLLDNLNSHCWTDQDSSECIAEEWLRVTSYYSLVANDLNWIARDWMARDGLMALIQVQYLLPSNPAERSSHRERIAALLQAIEDYSVTQASRYFTVSFTGIPWFQSDLVQSTKKDLVRMDVLVLPLALLLLGLALPRANPAVVWVIPLVATTSTICLWSIVMRNVARVMQITQFTPNIMMSVSIAMGVDYTLFLLARYLEDATNRRRAIVHMLTKGGQVIIVSGLTLMCAFVGLCFLPLQMLRSVGVGAAVSIGSALIVNLTVVPALLYTSVGDWIVREKSDDPNETETSEDDDHHNRHRSNSGRPLVSMPPPPPPSIWHRMSRHLMHPYRGIIILLITCQVLLVVAQQCTRVKSSLSFDLMLPTTSPSLQAFDSLGEKVGLGRLTPYRILFDGHEANVTITSRDGFRIMHRVLGELQAIDHWAVATETNGTSHIATSRDEFEILEKKLQDEMHRLDANRGRSATYSGISILANTQIPYEVFVGAKYCSQIEPHCPFEFMRVIDEMDSIATTQDRCATFVVATLAMSPFSFQGTEWLESARSAVRQLEERGALEGVQVSVAGSAAIASDAVGAVYSALPVMMITTILVVLALMGIYFRSIFPPLRSILSIALTLSFSFGLCVLVYQDGVLSWTHVRPLIPIGDEVCWLVPVMAFSVLVGVCLDYDVFLNSRILEYRLEGYEHKTAIASALHATGGIITAAGLIMALAFGSLMLSSSPVLYQWSFLLTTAVLLDTFVIRTIVVPIVIGLAGRYCWWPRELPEATVCLPEYQELLPEDVSGLLRTLEELSEYEPILSPRTP